MAKRYIVSDFNTAQKEGYGLHEWDIGDRIIGYTSSHSTGAPLGYLHFPDPKWTPILTPPKEGEAPYVWNAATKGQCTWYAYWRVQKNGYSPPCYYDRAKKQPAYTDAKDWLDEFREPWVPIKISQNPNYIPVPGDIIVFDGNYGHVAVIEKDNGKPDNFVTPVARNEDVDQIKATDPTLRVRLEPSLSGAYYCNITPGYYNVLSIIPATAADKKKTSGLTCWYEIESGKFCANITTSFLPSKYSSDIYKILEELNIRVGKLEEENASLKASNERLLNGIKAANDILTKLL